MSSHCQEKIISCIRYRCVMGYVFSRHPFARDSPPRTLNRLPEEIPDKSPESTPFQPLNNKSDGSTDHAEENSEMSCCRRTSHGTIEKTLEGKYSSEYIRFTPSTSALSYLRGNLPEIKAVENIFATRDCTGRRVWLDRQWQPI